MACDQSCFRHFNQKPTGALEHLYKTSLLTGDKVKQTAYVKQIPHMNPLARGPFIPRFAGKTYQLYLQSAAPTLPQLM